jgi:hypothetical protein
MNRRWWLGDGFHVRGEAAGPGQFMIDPSHDPLPGCEIGTTGTPETVTCEDAFATDFAQERGKRFWKVAEKRTRGGMWRSSAQSKHPREKYQRNMQSDGTLNP